MILNRLAEATLLDIFSIARIRSAVNPNLKIRTVIALCIGMKLPPMTIHDCNQLLIESGFEPLVKAK